MNFWNYFDEYPPALVRILARRKKVLRTEPLTDEEIAMDSGLPLWRVREIQVSEGWGGIPFSQVKSFCKGCGFDPANHMDRHRAKSYAKTGKFQYWTTSTMLRSHFYPLMEVLRRGRK